jgi:hypothetical protein
MEEIKLIDAKAKEEYLNVAQWNERYTKSRL